MLFQYLQSKRKLVNLEKVLENSYLKNFAKRKGLNPE